MLPIVGQLNGLTDDQLARIKRQIACKHVQKTGFAGTVDAGDSDSVASFDQQIKIIDNLVILKRQRAFFDLEHFFAESSLPKIDVDFSVNLHFVQAIL